LGRFLTENEIAKKFGVSQGTINDKLRLYEIPRRPQWAALSKGGGRTPHHGYWNITVYGERLKEHRLEAEKLLRRELRKDEQVHHKDGNSLNNHPRNMETLSISSHLKIGRSSYALPGGMRPSMFHFYMTMAHLLSYRSTCDRLKVGAIITSFDLEQVYAIGYNGNASELDNSCDSSRPGNCGCIHAEENAMIKCSIKDKNKILFVTDSPCLKCVKLIINSGFSWVYYMRPYRKTTPLAVLHYSGVKTCPYPLIIKSDSGGETFHFADPFTGNEAPDLSILDNMAEMSKKNASKMRIRVNEQLH